jgi:glycopeptide antibiotics resistance protein
VPLWNLAGNLRDGDRAQATLAGAAGSVVIELSQVAFPGVRRADVNDVLMNTLGTALGFLAWRLAARRRA